MILKLQDFDTLKGLAEKNPAALERLRLHHINKLIDDAPPQLQRRLRGLQFKIDAQISLQNTPMAACIKLTQMMNESFEHLRETLNYLSKGGTEPMFMETQSGCAEIIQFPQHKHSKQKI